MKTFNDFCNNITKEIFDIIEEKGSILKWHKDWQDVNGTLEMPVGSRGLYHGANLFGLLMVQSKKGFSSNKWLTFRQVNELGGKVLKGSKSETVYFWKIKEVKENDDPDNETLKKVPLFKTYNVFNLDQTSLAGGEQVEVNSSNANNISAINDLLVKLNVTVSNYGNRAFYSPVDDAIVLPKLEQFSSTENYYIVMLHELTHWTAGCDRLPRECSSRYATDECARAKEELVAEIGSVLLAVHFGISGNLENHASYVNSWKKSLDEKQVMDAANKAAKAFEWIISKSA